MPIIAYLGSTVNDYKQNSLSILLNMDVCCPNHTTSKMAVHDHYKRKIKETGEEILIYRFICYKCRKTVAILPDFLLPYKQYSANEIEVVLFDSESMGVYDIETDASVYTVRRWLKGMHKQIEVWISLLKAQVFKMENKMISEISLYGLSLMEQLTTLTNKLPKIQSCGNKLGYAAIYIFNHFNFKIIST